MPTEFHHVPERRLNVLMFQKIGDFDNVLALQCTVQRAP